MTSLTQEQKLEIVRLYKLKILNKNISTIMGLPKHVVNNYIYKDYLKTNERAKNTAAHLKLADEVIDMYKNGITIKNLREVQRMWEDGYRIANISYKLDLNYGQVEYWVRKMREGVYTSVH